MPEKVLNSEYLASPPRTRLLRSSFKWFALGISLLLVAGVPLLFALGGLKPLVASGSTVEPDPTSEQSTEPVAEPVLPVEEPATGEPAPVAEQPLVADEPAPVADEPAPVAEESVDTSADAPGTTNSSVDGEPTEVVAGGAASDAGPASGDPTPDEATSSDPVSAPARVLSVAARGAADSVNQCNGISNVGGETVTCNVTLTNNFTGDPATSTQIVCTDTGVGTTQTCTTFTGTSITSITQCDGSGNGGGSTVICNVTIINNVGPGVTLVDTTAVQCVDSGQGGGTEPTVVCSVPPGTPGSTTPTVNQCNGSGNGGGGTLRVLCSVTGDNMTVPIFIDQCNGSGNGGGATVICTVSITTNIIPDGGGDNGGGGGDDGGGGGDDGGGGDGDGDGGGGGGDGDGDGDGGGGGGGGDTPPGGEDAPPGGEDAPPGGGGNTPPGAGNTPPGSSGPPNGGGTTDNPGALPFTGFDPGITALFGLLTLLLGVSLRSAARRRYS